VSFTQIRPEMRFNSDLQAVMVEHTENVGRNLRRSASLEVDALVSRGLCGYWLTGLKSCWRSV
jgi:hypothetical protein